MEKILVVGIGATGAKVGVELNNKFNNSELVLINSSSQEIKSMAGIVPEDQMMVIDNHNGGAGKDRTVGYGFFKNNSDDILEFIASKSAGVDFIFTCFSTAGGTGSGVGPALTALMRTEQFFKLVQRTSIDVMGIPVLPSSDEGIASMTNTKDCLNHIVKLSKSAAFALASNDFFSSGSLVERYAECNRSIAETVSRYISVFGTSREGSLDRRDRLAALQIPGIHTFAIPSWDNDEDMNVMGPFIHPEGCRVKRLNLEVSEEKSDAAASYTLLQGLAVDDVSIGYIDTDAKFKDVIHAAGWNNLSKVASTYSSQLNYLWSKAKKAEKNDLSGRGMEGLKAEKLMFKEEYGSQVEKNADSILDLLDDDDD